MRTTNNSFKVADRADKCGAVIFYTVLLASGILAFHENPHTDEICHPILVVAAALAVLATVVTTIYQTEGNRALRATQLSNALGAGIGEPIRSDYYNNTLPESLQKLAATTLENTLFTRAILSKMAVKMRFKVGTYFIVLLVFCVCRTTPTGWLLVLAQSLFSADLVLKMIRLERFRVRTVRVQERLEQHFLQEGGCEKPNDIAVLVGAFADYECAKDEAALPLESKYFEKLNPELSKQWEEMRQRLKIK